MNDEKDTYFIDCGGCDEGDHDETMQKLNRLVGKRVLITDEVFDLRKEIPSAGIYEIVGCRSYVDPRNGSMPFGTELALRHVGPPADGNPTLDDLMIN